jgi:hypothetical protein
VDLNFNYFYSLSPSLSCSLPPHLPHVCATTVCGFPACRYCHYHGMSVHQSHRGGQDSHAAARRTWHSRSAIHQSTTSLHSHHQIRRIARNPERFASCLCLPVCGPSGCHNPNNNASNNYHPSPLTYHHALIFESELMMSELRGWVDSS